MGHCRYYDAIEMCCLGRVELKFPTPPKVKDLIKQVHCNTSNVLYINILSRKPAFYFTFLTDCFFFKDFLDRCLKDCLLTNREFVELMSRLLQHCLDYATYMQVWAHGHQEWARGIVL